MMSLLELGPWVFNTSHILQHHRLPAIVKSNDNTSVHVPPHWRVLRANS
jgi:hypothetical protein